MEPTFDKNIFQALIGGRPPMDLPLSLIKNQEDALSFLKGYGYDLTKPKDEKKLWDYYARAVSYIKSYLLEDQEENIPRCLADPAQLQSLQHLLVHASSQLETDKHIQNWACAILKVIHVLVHLDNDLFAQFSTKIQNQILKPFRQHIFEDKIQGGHILGGGNNQEKIHLHKFSKKNFKRSDSSVTKLLAKPEQVAFTILDKIGVRFVTKSVYDSFRVMKYLVNHNVIGIFHIIHSESNNSLYPIQLFIDTLSEAQGKNLSHEEIESHLQSKLQQTMNKEDLLVKPNEFTGRDYKFIKFICRKLIKLEFNENDKFNFFYPFEVQIVDYNTYIKNLSGPSSHEEYKMRQKAKAKQRILGFMQNENNL